MSPRSHGPRPPPSRLPLVIPSFFTPLSPFSLLFSSVRYLQATLKLKSLPVPKVALGGLPNADASLSAAILSPRSGKVIEKASLKHDAEKSLVTNANGFASLLSFFSMFYYFTPSSCCLCCNV